MEDTIVAAYKHAALEVGLGRTYGHTGDHSQDCVRIQSAILSKLWGEDVVRPFLKELHLATHPLGSTANVACIEREGWGTGVSSRVVTKQPGVYYVQGWRGGAGHCFAVVTHQHPVGWTRTWILEATNSSADRDGDGTKDANDWFRPVDVQAQLDRFDTLAIAFLFAPPTLEKP